MACHEIDRTGLIRRVNSRECKLHGMTAAEILERHYTDLVPESEGDAVTRSLAIEYAGHGIRVNAVAPGIIATPMHKPETHAFLAGLHPVGRMGTVQEVVEAVLYLEDAKFVTGETLHVDGGAHAGHW